MKVYKGTDKDMKCRGFQYELGVTVMSDDAIRCGGNGFHSCEAPFDVLRYYPNKDGNRFFVATAGGKIDRTDADDSKIASSEITLDKEISFDELRTAQIEYTRTKAESGEHGGNGSSLACGNGSNLAGGYWSNLAVGIMSNIVGGYCSNIAGGDNSNIDGGNRSNIAGGDGSNLAGGNMSNLAGGDRSNLAGGNRSNLAGGDRSNLAGGDRSTITGGDGSNIYGGDRSTITGGDGSNIAGGDRSLIVGRYDCKAKAGMNSVIVLTEWKRTDGKYTPVSVKAAIVDGIHIKADTWYRMVDGEFTEVE